MVYLQAKKGANKINLVRFDIHFRCREQDAELFINHPHRW